MSTGGEFHPNRMPGAEDAVAHEEKFTKFLLDLAHPKGKERARWFARLGFSLERGNWRDLRAQLLAALPRVPAERRRETRYGEEWEAVIEIQGQGRRGELLTGWEIRRSGDPPRFVTAYPARRRRRA